jgi:hypothetical protein
MWKSDPVRTKLRKAARYAAFALVAIVLFAVAPGVHALARSLFALRSVQTRALEILRREQLRFLVTDRVVAQVVVESDGNSLGLGKREGYLIAKVALYFGVDFGKLPKGNVVRDGMKVVVTIPEPEELDFSVDLDSMRYLTKRSGLQVATDWLLDRDQKAELRSQLKEAARAYLRDEQLLPTRGEIVGRLNEFGGLVGGRLGVEVVFR